MASLGHNQVPRFTYPPSGFLWRARPSDRSLLARAKPATRLACASGTPEMGYLRIDAGVLAKLSLFEIVVIDLCIAT